MQEGTDYHLIELRRPDHGWNELQALSAKARSAAERVNSDELPVRFLRSIFVPDDETCFVLCEAASFDAVRKTAERAALTFERIAEAIPSRDPDEAQP
jgi:hypothetical protein